MEITFDPKADAMYIKLKDGKFDKTKVIDNYETILDFDKEGKILGIELLNVSLRFPLKEIINKNMKVPIKILGK